MSRFLIRASKLVAAPPHAVFDLLADPALHHTFDGSGTVQGVSTPSTRLYLGAVFGMDMKIGARYRSTNTVTEFEENKRIAWEPKGNYTWRYLLQATDGGTLVTEEWDARRSPRRFMMAILGFPARNRLAIEETLTRLASQFAAQ